MRVLYVLEWFPDYAAKATYEWCIRLAARGHEVFVVTSDFDQTGRMQYTPGLSMMEGIRVLRVQSKSIRLLGTQYVFYRPASVAEAWRFIRRARPELVHIQSYWGMLGLMCMLVPGFRRIPRVVTIHGIIAGYNNVLLNFIAALLNCASGTITSIAAKRVLSVSKRDVSRIKSWGVGGDRIRYIPNGVDLSVFTPLSSDVRNRIREDLRLPLDKVIVLFLAHLRQAKGVTVLLQAIESVTKSGLDVYFVIAGEGPLKSVIENEIAGRGISESVMMLGFVEDDDLALVFGSSDIYVLPSFLEGMPVSLMQAMACGLAVIATAVGDVPELVRNQESGILIDVGDPSELADAIRLLAEDGELRNRLGNSSRESIARFDLEAIAKEYELIYEELLGSFRV